MLVTFHVTKLGVLGEKKGIFWKKSSFFEKKVQKSLVVSKKAVPLHRF